MKVNSAISGLTILIVWCCISWKNVINASEDFKNVCVDWQYYYGTRDKYCYSNPTAYYEVPDVIKYYGYPVEEYTVTTPDGYILKMFRIPNEGKPPVFITHGARRNCMIYLDVGENSLAYVLWRSGYDVWLLNYRGSMYSSHISLNNTQKEFWDFSFHENAIYDNPAGMNLVYKTTGKKMIYVGYSMGATSYFILNSLQPEYAKSRIGVGVLLAPVAYFHDLKTPTTIVTTDGLYQILLFILEHFIGGAINVRTPDYIKRAETMCMPYPFQMEACMQLTYLFEGYDSPQHNPETLPIIVMQHFDAVSVKTGIHYMQFIRSNNFTHYDYGKNKNLKVYGTSDPPPYNLTNILVPTLFIRGDGDWLATEKDLQKTMSEMRPTAKIGVYEIPYKPFTHGDFTDAKDASSLVYDYIVHFLKVNGSEYL